jgi:invasion protein IalB
MTAWAASWAVAICALLVPAVGIVTASAQGVLSPNPMVEHRSIEARPPAPAANSAAAKRSASPSQAVVGAEAVKPDLSEEVGDWLLQCFSKPGRACRLSQRQVNPKNKAMLIWVELTHVVAPKMTWQFV